MVSRCVSVVAGVALAACAARPRVVPAGERAIGRLVLSGTSSVDDGDLRDGLGLTRARKRGEPFARVLVAIDRRRIRSYYVRRGFFAAKVRARVEREPDRADVTFTISEGPRAHLDRVELTGAPDDPALDAAALRAQVPLADGDPFDYDAYDRGRAAVIAALREHGYARAAVDGVVVADQVRAAAVIRLTVTPGPRAVFGTTAVHGVPDGLRGAVDARLAVEPGARYAPRALDRTRTALYEMGRFSVVQVEPDPGSRGEVVDVVVTAVPAKRHELRLGGGVGFDPLAFEVRGRAQYGVAAWPWPLTTARAELRPAVVYQRDARTFAPRLDAIASLERLDLIRPRYTGTAEASFSYLATEAFTSYGPQVRLNARSPTFAGAVRLGAAWQLGQLRYRDISDILDAATVTRLGLDQVERVGAFEQSVVIDLRDDRVAPHRGLYLELRAEEGTVAAGGELSYLRATPEARAYVSLGPVVLAARGRAGVLTGDVPATRRFFAGGANSQRGFPERHLAPFAERTVDGTLEQVPYGGTALAELSAELRFPLPRIPRLPIPRVGDLLHELPLAGAVFVDAADVTESWDDLDAAALHTACGLSLRTPTGLGALRFDVGYRLNRLGAGEPRPGQRWAYHLGLGEAF